MTALLLSPHNDDETLFASFTCLREQPHVVVVLRSQVQADRYGITAETREAETGEAMRILGCEWQQWPFLDREPDWDAVEVALGIADERLEPEVVFAPAVEDGGHDQHNRVGVLAHEVFGARVRPYLTYRRGYAKTAGAEVVPEPEWIALKHRALACYASQIREPSTREWFLADLREYVP